MSKKKKTRRDVAEIARENLEKIIGEKLNGEPLDKPLATSNNKRGKRGGKVGGPARAAKLSADDRRRIAKKAAQVRWGLGRS